MNTWLMSELLPDPAHLLSYRNAMHITEHIGKQQFLQSERGDAQSLFPNIPLR
ncbi:hypothetical protein [Paenibacillus glucanolyticus]|uniref:hypothetical protein n=1 Tax=Paenibacillus glucanolyticus TaxID=59843 RepID=UPI0012E80439|nr:hypothetical protein [Paenibacillus glucanolyticus]